MIKEKCFILRQRQNIGQKYISSDARSWHCVVLCLVSRCNYVHQKLDHMYIFKAIRCACTYLCTQHVRTEIISTPHDSCQHGLHKSDSWSFCLMYDSGSGLSYSFQILLLPFPPPSLCRASPTDREGKIDLRVGHNICTHHHLSTPWQPAPCLLVYSAMFKDRLSEATNHYKYRLL